MTSSNVHKPTTKQSAIATSPSPSKSSVFKPDAITAPKPRAYSRKDAFRILGIGPTKGDLLIREGVLKSVKIGRKRLILDESIDALLNQTRT